jgi:ATP-dependent RNA helicase SUPV3L1/SUV3
MLDNLLLDQVREELKLRKLIFTTIHLKQRKILKKLVVGTIFKKSGLTMKVNFLMDNISESELSKYILDKKEEFFNKFQENIDKFTEYLEIFKGEDSKIVINFKNMFLGALSNYSQDNEKKDVINFCFKQIEKKSRNLNLLHQEEDKLKILLDQLQITEYHTYFTKARLLKRKLKLYLGPTNSGKTYQALNDLALHEKGVYLSPLRLLAWEGKEEIEKRGKPTSLITGEERQIVEGAKFKSQTIETLNFSEEVGAILIDEVQMIYDKDRGWAWTQALIGAPCKELIMAGSPESESIIQKIADFLGEELEIIRLNRFNPLEVAKDPVSLEQDLKHLPEGTAIIAFSRKNILGIKKYFENNKKPVSVIYGNLSPEVRKQEAKKFRDGKTKYLISSDAIAMGLNLPISNILFTTIEKFNGKKTTTLTPMEIKQISGRAGRYGKIERGSVSALDNHSLKYIRKTIDLEGEKNDFLYIKPNIEHVKTIGKELKTSQLFPILTFFTNKVMSKRSNLYVCSDLSEKKEVALLLDKIPDLSLEDKFLFNNAPVPGEDHYDIYVSWIKDYQRNKIVPVPGVKILNPRVFNYDNQLILENYVKLLNLYSWLTYKKPEVFTEHSKCLEVREESNKKIEDLLSKPL